MARVVLPTKWDCFEMGTLKLRRVLHDMWAVALQSWKTRSITCEILSNINPHGSQRIRAYDRWLRTFWKLLPCKPAPKANQVCSPKWHFVPRAATSDNIYIRFTTQLHLVSFRLPLLTHVYPVPPENLHFAIPVGAMLWCCVAPAQGIVRRGLV